MHMLFGSEWGYKPDPLLSTWNSRTEMIKLPDLCRVLTDTRVWPETRTPYSLKCNWIVGGAGGRLKTDVTLDGLNGEWTKDLLHEGQINLNTQTAHYSWMALKSSCQKRTFAKNLWNQLNVSLLSFAHLTEHLSHISRAEHSDDYLFKILTTLEH